jgi:hypothetical protein
MEEFNKDVLMAQSLLFKNIYNFTNSLKNVTSNHQPGNILDQKEFATL